MVLTVHEKTFSQEVLDASVPVLVNFWAPWCGICRIVNPFLIRFQAELTQPIKLVGINADENFRLATTYKLTSLPTLLLFSNGEILYRLDELRSREDLQWVSQQLQEILETVEVDYVRTA